MVPTTAFAVNDNTVEANTQVYTALAASDESEDEVKTFTFGYGNIDEKVKALSTVEYINNDTSGMSGGVRTWNDPIKIQFINTVAKFSVHAFVQYDMENQYDVPWTYIFNKSVTIVMDNCFESPLSLIGVGPDSRDQAFGKFIFNAPLTIIIKNGSSLISYGLIRIPGLSGYYGNGNSAKTWGCEINSDYNIYVEDSSISYLNCGIEKYATLSSKVPLRTTNDEYSGKIENGVHIELKNSYIGTITVGHTLFQPDLENYKAENYYVKGDSTIDLINSEIGTIYSSKTTENMKKYGDLDGKLSVTMDKDSKLEAINAGASYMTYEEMGSSIHLIDCKTGSSPKITLTTAAPLTMEELHHVDEMNMGGSVSVTKKMSLPIDGMNMILTDPKSWKNGDVLLDYTYTDGGSTVDETKVTSNWSHANITMAYQHLANENRQQWYLNVASLKYDVIFDASQHGSFTDVQDTFITQNVTENQTVAGVPAITADSDYIFSGWQIDGVGKIYTDDEILDMPITGNIRFVAAYTIIPTYTVSFDVGQNGTFTVANNPLADQMVKLNKAVTDVPSVTANTGYAFNGWQVNGTGDVYTAEQVKAMAITANTKFVANYTKKNSGGNSSGGMTSYVIKASVGAGGAISPSGNVNVSRGSNKTFIITADKGYKISDVLVDGKSVGAVSTYTFSNVREAHTITAAFIKETATDAVTNPDTTGVSGKLNTKEHLAFMQGYGNNLFGPNREVTRAQVAQIFYNLLLNKDVDTTVSFSDVPDTAWYSKAVNTLASMDVIKGIGQGKFAPERAISRAEFAAIATRFAKAANNGDVSFADVPKDAWYYNNVLTAARYGWIDGYTDNTFKPNKTITRAESAKIVNRMLARSADKTFVSSNTDVRRFTDVTSDYWAYNEIAEASNAHDYNVTNNSEKWTNLKYNSKFNDMTGRREP